MGTSRAAEDRASRELRAYARQEWGSNPEWLSAALHHAPAWTRLRKWVRRRRASKLPSPPIEEDGSGESERLPAPVAAAVLCPHPSTEDLGFGDAAQFLQCSVCGTVLVVHGPHRWYLDPLEPAGREEMVRG